MGGLCAACFGACQVHIAMHSLCCGFGEGKFREVSATTSPFDAEAEIAFDLKDASDLVMLDKKVLSLAEAIRAKKASTGAASVCYHTMQEKPGEDTFTLQQARPDESCLFPVFFGLVGAAQDPCRTTKSCSSQKQASLVRTLRAPLHQPLK